MSEISIIIKNKKYTLPTPMELQVLILRKTDKFKTICEKTERSITMVRQCYAQGIKKLSAIKCVNFDYFSDYVKRHGIECYFKSDIVWSKWDALTLKGPK